MIYRILWVPSPYPSGCFQYPLRVLRYRYLYTYTLHANSSTPRVSQVLAQFDFGFSTILLCILAGLVRVSVWNSTTAPGSGSGSGSVSPVCSSPFPFIFLSDSCSFCRWTGPVCICRFLIKHRHLLQFLLNYVYIDRLSGISMGSRGILSCLSADSCQFVIYLYATYLDLSILKLYFEFNLEILIWYPRWRWFQKHITVQS